MNIYTNQTVLFTFNSNSYAVHTNCEKRLDMSLLLTRSGLYPKDREKMLNILSLEHPIIPNVYGVFMDQSDLEFLRDKIKPEIFRGSLYYSSHTIEQIKNFVDLGFSTTNFNLYNIIRRTYENTHKMLMPISGYSGYRILPYTKPKNPKEKKYYEMIEQTSIIHHPDPLKMEPYINTIFVFMRGFT